MTPTDTWRLDTLLALTFDQDFPFQVDLASSCQGGCSQELQKAADSH